MSTSLLITSAKILRPDFSIDFGNIYIEDNRIVEIGKVNVEAEYVIDGKNKLAMPGLVNLHTHSPMSIMRGVSDDKDLMPWLEELWKVEDKLTKEHIYLGARLALLEMIKTGTTAFLDMYWHMDEVAKASKGLGIRGFLGWSVVDEDKTTQPAPPLKSAERFIRDWKGDDLVTPCIAPHAAYTCNEETLLKSRDIAEKYDTLIHFHLSETRVENEEHYNKTGYRPIPWLDKIGFLNERVIAAHAVWVTKGEIQTLAKHNVKIAYNPTSNMKLASGGVMPWPEMKAAGITVGLGTDSVVSNNNLDMFEEMKLASLLQKMHRWDPKVLSATESLDMAIYDGAKALGLNYGISEGNLADIILVDLMHVSMIPHIDLVSNLVYSANGDVVVDSIINGRIVMRDRHVNNEEEIKESVLSAVKDLIVE